MLQVIMNKSVALFIASLLTLMSYGQNFNTYWYNNEAEISSYELVQARYGEMHKGKAVLIFVTEPFSPTRLVKPNKQSNQDISVLKLNAYKNFNTGIYPYNILTSTYLPVNDPKQCLKVVSNMQEWCGISYTEIKRKEATIIDHHSYFDQVSFQDKLFNKNLILENEIWNKLRIDPNQIKTGRVKMLPSVSFLNLMGISYKPYDCIITKDQQGDSFSLELYYPELDRTLSISVEQSFPYKILGWEESYKNFGHVGKKGEKLTTSATLLKTIKSDYWNKYKVKDLHLRKELGLE